MTEGAHFENSRTTMGIGQRANSLSASLLYGCNSSISFTKPGPGVLSGSLAPSHRADIATISIALLGYLWNKWDKDIPQMQICIFLFYRVGHKNGDEGEMSELCILYICYIHHIHNIVMKFKWNARLGGDDLWIVGRNAHLYMYHVLPRVLHLDLL